MEKPRLYIALNEFTNWKWILACGDAHHDAWRAWRRLAPIHEIKIVIASYRYQDGFTINETRLVNLGEYRVVE